MAAPTSVLTALHKQLASTDAAARREGVAAACALTDPAAVAGLLEGVAFVAPSTGSDGGLRGGAVFTGKNAPEQVRLDASLWAVLRALSPTRNDARALCESVTALTISSGVSTAEVDLSDLVAFTQLGSLRVIGARPMTGMAALAALPALRRVSFERCGLGDGLAPLASSRSIEHIRVDGELTSFGDLGEFRSLKTLVVNSRFRLANLAGVERLASLESLAITGMTSALDLKALKGLRSLRHFSLSLSGQLKSLDGIDGCERLESLAVTQTYGVTSIAALAGLRALTDLDLSGDYNVSDLRPLSELRALRRVNLTGVTMTSLDALAGTALESLDLTRCQRLLDLKALAGCTTLRAIGLHGVSACASLDGLEDSTLITSLDLEWTTSLTSIRALRKLTALTELKLSNVPNLASLDGLQDAHALVSLTARVCPKLADLTAIKGLRSLATLALDGDVLVSDDGVFESLPAIEKLDLRSCKKITDAAPLARIATLHALALWGSSVDRKSLPASLAAVTSWARVPDLDARVEEVEPKEAPTRHDPLPKGTGAVVRKKVGSLRKLLNARDFEQIDQGCELLAALADDTLWEQFLGGVTWAIDEKMKVGEFTPNAFFDGPKVAKPYRDHALFRLISTAPEGSATAAALRDSITALQIEGHVMWKPITLDLTPYAALPKLAVLKLHQAKQVAHPEAMAKMSALRELSLMDCSPTLFQHVQGLGIRTLSVVRFPIVELTGLSTLSALEALVLNTLTNVGELSLKGCAALKTLDVMYANQITALDLTGCRSLTRLQYVAGARPDAVEVRGVEDLTALSSLMLNAPSSAALATGLLRAPSLRFVEIMQDAALCDLSALAHLTELRTLKMVGARSLANLDALARFPNLETLHLESCVSLPDLAPLGALTKLKHLSLRQSRVQGDLKVLDGLTKLKRLDLAFSQRAPADLSERLRSLARWT